jgi:hypothetical protein
MDRARHELLPGPAFTGDQDGRFHAGHLGRTSERIEKNRRAADDLLESIALVQLASGALQALFERPRAVLERRDLHTLVDRIQQVFIIKRFRQEVRRTCFERAHGHRDVAVAGQEYDRDLKI